MKNSPSQIAGPPLPVPNVLARRRMSAPPQRKEWEVIRDETVSPLNRRYAVDVKTVTKRIGPL